MNNEPETKMSRRKKDSAVTVDEAATEPSNLRVLQDPTPETPADVEGQPEGVVDDAPPPPPLRESDEVLPNVESAASTITNCTEAELKNYLATADYVCRQVSLQLADRWKDICRTAESITKESSGDEAAKVKIGISVTADLTNLELMDTSVKLGFSKKFSSSASTQEDLRQTKFKLILQAQGASQE